MTHQTRADVSLVVVASGTEPGLPGTVVSLLDALDHAAHGAEHLSGARWLRGERLGGEVVLVLRDVTGLPRVVRADSRVRVIAAPRVGDARARNLGIAAARGRYLLFTTAEVRVPREWVAAMTTPLRAGHADLVGGAVHLAEPVPWLPPDLATDLFDLVPDPPPSGRACSAASTGVSRAVVEAIGFDEALGTPRYPGTGDAVFRLDAIGAGFRECPVGGVSVEICPDRPAPTPRVIAARARAHARRTAYLDRCLRGVRPAPARSALCLAGWLLVLAGRVLRRPGTPAATLRAHAAVAYHRELLHLRRAGYRPAPQSAAGDTPGGAGGSRAAAAVALVSRGAVPPTVLPPLAIAPGAVDGGSPGPIEVGSAIGHPTADPARGSVYGFWGPGRAGPVVESGPVVEVGPVADGTVAAPPEADRLLGTVAG